MNIFQSHIQLTKEKSKKKRDQKMECEGKRKMRNKKWKTKIKETKVGKENIRKWPAHWGTVCAAPASFDAFSGKCTLIFNAFSGRKHRNTHVCRYLGLWPNILIFFFDRSDLLRLRNLPHPSVDFLADTTGRNCLLPPLPLPPTLGAATLTPGLLKPLPPPPSALL